MRPEIILRRQLERARTLMDRRDPAVSHAARRALGSASIVLDALRSRGELRPYIEATLRATHILFAIEQRGRRRGDRARAHKLADSRLAAKKKASDDQLLSAWLASGCRVRETARNLQLAPSTVSRRIVALCDGTQHTPRGVSLHRRKA